MTLDGLETRPDRGLRLGGLAEAQAVVGRAVLLQRRPERLDGAAQNRHLCPQVVKRSRRIVELIVLLDADPHSRPSLTGSGPSRARAASPRAHSSLRARALSAIPTQAKLLGAAFHDRLGRCIPLQLACERLHLRLGPRAVLPVP